LLAGRVAQVFSEQSEASKAGGTEPSPILPSDSLVDQLQNIHLRLELANHKKDLPSLQRHAADLVRLVDRITVIGGVEKIDLDNTVALIGNCALELENGTLYQHAEDLWKRAIGLSSTHAGIHYQYADFLIDRNRISDSVSELRRAQELNPGDSRVPYIEAKIALKSGPLDPSVGESIKARFERDPGNERTARLYLMYLDSTDAPVGEFEAACKAWEEASANAKDKWSARRALADYLAENQEPDRARDIYLALLDGCPTDEVVETYHNLAMVSDSLGDTPGSERYWTHAYSLDRANLVVRAAFSQRLQRWGKLELALRVSSGEPLDGPDTL
jgi:tetratricopeptide (TPR) repeat protein